MAKIPADSIAAIISGHRTLVRSKDAPICSCCRKQHDVTFFRHKHTVYRKNGTVSNQQGSVIQPCKKCRAEKKAAKCAP